VLFVLSLDRRRLLHIDVTAHPYAEWASQQIVEAVGFDTAIARLNRDRDGSYGPSFDARVEPLGIHQFVIAPKAPWQNGHAERYVGTLRRELLNHVIVLGERHLLRLVKAHTGYYNEDRPQMARQGDAPVSRAVEVPGSGPVSRLLALVASIIDTRGLHEPVRRVFRHDNRRRCRRSLIAS
jgi:transposase InsO family protein